MSRTNIRLLTTAVLTVVIFVLFDFLYPPYTVVDVPKRHGVPFVYSEHGCYMVLRDGQPDCVNRFRPDLLFADLFGIAIPMYGISILATRRKGSSRYS